MIDFICVQNPQRKVDDSSFISCAVGDYVRSTGREARYESFQPKNEFEILLDTEICISSYGKTDVFWNILMTEWIVIDGSIQGNKERTYGDLQRRMIQAKLVADPNGGKECAFAVPIAAKSF